MTPESQVPEGAVIITPNQVYAEMQDIARKVDHLTTVLDPALQQVREGVRANAERVAVITAERKAEDAKLDGRLRALENWRWWILGIATVVGPLGGYVLSQVVGG